MNKHTVRNTFAEHLFEYRSVEKKKLILSLSITLGVMIVEFAGGIFTSSIALISDAGHMFTHSFAIGMSLVAIIIARKPPCHHKTFGLYRAEILVAFINGLFLMLVVGAIIYGAIQRIIHPREILTLHMLMIAIIGLGVNLASILILHGSHKTDLNIKSVFYHVVSDAISSVGIVIAAIIIMYTGWTLIDPLVSLGISALILWWVWGILKESAIILLEMAPAGLDIDIISNDLKANFPEIKELHNVHLWTITVGMYVFSAHLKLNEALSSSPQDELTLRVSGYLFEKYKIVESTIQITAKEGAQVCKPR